MLQRARIALKSGTIVDATIFSAPCSTKKKEKQRDPEMHQTRKGKQWHFGMMLHIGVDSEGGLAHSAVVTAADIHDKHALPKLLHGFKRRVYGGSAYHNQTELIESAAPLAKDCTNERVRKPGGDVDEAKRASNREKSKVRARVEHVFGVIKRLWVLPRYGIAPWTRTLAARLSHWLWPIFTWPENHCWNRCFHRRRRTG